MKTGDRVDDEGMDVPYRLGCDEGCRQLEVEVVDGRDRRKCTVQQSSDCVPLGRADFQGKHCLFAGQSTEKVSKQFVEGFQPQGFWNDWYVDRSGAWQHGCTLCRKHRMSDVCTSTNKYHSSKTFV